MLFYSILLTLVLTGKILAGSTQEKPNNSFEKSIKNPEEGPYFEGDIILPKSNAKFGVRSKVSKWPKGVVPFEIDGTFKDLSVRTIRKAMRTIENTTCIKFRPRNRYDKNYVRLIKKDKGCFAELGRMNRPQILNLEEPVCTERFGTVLHELLHTLGIYHEQSRYDRDDHIYIIKENIEKGKEHNFEKPDKSVATDFGLRYDYGSIMHYSSYAFSVNNKPTIVPKFKVRSGTIGQRKMMSPLDIKKINIMYKCP